MLKPFWVNIEISGESIMILIKRRGKYILQMMMAFLLLSFPVSFALSAAGDKTATDFIQSMGNSVVSCISNASLSADQKKEKLRGILDRNFDMATISRFTLGHNWKKLTPDQQKEYQILFEDMIVSIYADKFSSYNGQQFKVTGAQSVADSNDQIVSSEIIPENGENIDVDWRIRMKGDKYTIVDVAINKVSMIITQRADFASIIQRNGGDAASILVHLRSRSKEKT
jgi:phospholipid transport system substrate-binding protein